MKYKIRKLMTAGDIVPNIIESYPENILLGDTYDEFYDCILQNSYTFLCYHITRMTDLEIQNVKEHGLLFCNKSLLLKKISDLPGCCDWFKPELSEYIRNLRCTQADNALCTSYGFLDLDKDPAYDNIFHTNWGGETIYNYYDEGNGFENKYYKKIHETLQAISHPLLIVLRANITMISEIEIYDLYEKLHNNDIHTLSGNFYLNKEVPRVAKIISLDKYNGIDFN